MLKLNFSKPTCLRPSKGSELYLGVHIFTLVLGLCLIASCKSSDDDSGDEDAGVSGTGQIPTTPADDGSDDPFIVGRDSVVVTGTNLNLVFTYCSTDVDEVAGTSNLYCHALMGEAQGANLVASDNAKIAKEFPAGVVASWNHERKYVDDQDPTCTVSARQTKYQCRWPVTNIAIRGQAELQLSDSTGAHLHDASSEVKFKNECENIVGANNYSDIGLGTEAFPYLWCEPSQLSDFANNGCSSGQYDACDAHIRVGADMDGSDVAEMIGSSAKPYTGIIQSGASVSFIESTGELEEGGSEGTHSAGGITSMNGGEIIESWATGTIEAYTGGGIAGTNGGLIRNSYARVQVKGTEVGGLTGLSTDESHTEFSYASGKVLTAYNDPEDSLGGLVGKNDENLAPNHYTGNFWDVNTTTRDNAYHGVSGNAGGIVGKSTQAMQDMETFSAWDFDAVWAQTPGDYPYLRAEALLPQ